MFLRSKIRQICAMLLGGLMLASGQEAQAQVRPTRLSVNINGNDVFLLVKIPRRRYRWMIGRNWRPTVRVWLRRPTGWRQIRFTELTKRRYTQALSRRRICRHAVGKAKLVLQLGVRNGRMWWNRFSRMWQQDFISIQQHAIHIPCNEIPDDWPPAAQPN